MAEKSKNSSLLIKVLLGIITMLVVIILLLLGFKIAGVKNDWFGFVSSPTPTITSPQSKIDAISGTWIGIAKSGDFEYDAKFIIGKSCEIGSVCGTFEFPTISCSGTLTITEVDGNLYKTSENNLTSGCLTTPTIQNYFQLLPDGNLLYVFETDGYPETRAILYKSNAPLTFTLEPTATQTATATPAPIIKIWENKASLLIESPIKYKSRGGWYTEEFPGSGVTFNADTRWKFDIEVDDKSKEATGMMFYGYAANGDIQILGFFYQSGSWHLGYAPRNNEYRYWWDFDNLTSPKQSFVLSISQDGKSMSIKNNEGFREDAKYQVKLFDGAGIITAGFMSSPRVNIAISSLFIEQYSG